MNVRLAAALAAVSLFAQQKPAAPGIYLAKGTPSIVRALLKEYGDRLEKAGNERVSLSGTLTDKDGTNSATLIAELPSIIQLTVPGTGKVLTYNGVEKSSNGRSELTPDDEDLLESLQADASESFFYSYGTTASARLLGKRFRTDSGTNKVYAGPWYDIYELTGPVAVKTGAPTETKLYYFDSQSQILAKCRYRISRGGKTVEVETVYSGWSKSNGQALPGRIERFEDGKSVFSFSATASQVTGRATDGAFGR